MMVTKARAHLGYEDNEIGVYSDHSKIAKIDISSTGPYLSIKQAIDRAILGNSVQKGSLGHPAMHLSSDSPVRRSVSAGPLLGDDEEPRTGLTPGLAVPLGRSKSMTDTEGKVGSVTVTGPKSSRHRTDRVGEDLPINRAIHDGDVAKVRDLLKDAQLDRLDSQGYTPLMVAAATDQEHIVNHLIRRGASMKISGPKGDTAFHLACRHGGVDVASIFLKHAELLDVRGAEGRTPLMSSIRGSRADTAKLLLDSTGNVEASDEDGKTALHYAAMKGQTEVVRLLIIDRGANQDRTTKKKGWTPLHYAAQRWHPKVVELLGKNGADCNALTSKEDGARSAIHLVLLKSGRTRCITLLMRYGADIDQPDGAGKTPLHRAAQHGEPDSIKWLVSKKANLEARTRDIDQRTPLHIAVEARRLEIAKILLDAGANKDAAMEPPYGKTALHIATFENDIDLVKELLARKANVDPIYNPDPRTYPAIMPTSRNITPLWIATEDQSLKIMRLLLEAGADVEGKSSNIKPRPLLVAVLKENLAAVRTLLDYNAAPETKGPTTPLTEATEAGNIPIMKALLTRGVGADVERTNIKGYPCLFIAATLGHVEAVEVLLNHGADPDREVVVESLLSSKNTRKAGEYFKSYVSAESQRRIREMLRNCLWKR